MRRAVGAGGRVLYLLPEVAPTGGLAAAFRKDYGRTAVVFHGRMTERQKEDAWRALRSGRASLVAGTRSALFVEMDALRLIVVDDEQDESYVQAESPAYDARRGAFLRARCRRRRGRPRLVAPDRRGLRRGPEKAGILIGLGTEPPRTGVVLVDHPRDVPLVSRELESQAPGHHGRGEPAILFLNRRGYAAQIECGGCGRVPRCPRCDIALVFHKAESRLVCHYCNHSVDVDTGCDGCGGRVVVRRGAGTQAVEEELSGCSPAPGGPVRFGHGRDPGRAGGASGGFRQGATRSSSRPSFSSINRACRRPGSSAILRPESLLGFSDYRAGQKTFEAVSAMLDFRRDGPGAEAVIQTAAPAHFSVAAAAAGDYLAFFEKEIEFRRMLNYPPFASLAEVTLQGRDVRALGGKSRELLALFQKHAPELEVLGPAFAPVARVRDLTRVQLILKAAERETIDRALRDALPKIRLKKIGRLLLLPVPRINKGISRDSGKSLQALARDIPLLPGPGERERTPGSDRAGSGRSTGVQVLRNIGKRALSRYFPAPFLRVAPKRR